MKYANKIKISVFCRQGEDENKIRGKLFSLIPFNLEEEKVGLKQDTATGFNKSIIKTFEIELTRDKHLNLFLKNLNEKFNDQQRELLIRQVKSRLGDDLNFFIRLDKDRLLEDQPYITDSGNCFHIKISVAAFPATREKAIETIKSIFAKQQII